MSDQFDLKYLLTRDDYGEFALLTGKRPSQGVFLWMIGLGLIPIAVAKIAPLCLSCELDGHSMEVGAAVTLVLLYAYVLLSQRVAARTLSKGLRQEGGALGERRLVARQNDLETSSPHRVTTYSWRLFQSVSIHKRIIVLWTDAVAGIMVTRSAFANLNDEAAFLKYCEDRIAEANSAADA